MARRRSTSKKGAAVSPRAQAVTRTPADAAAEAYVMMGWLTLDGVENAPLQAARTGLYAIGQEASACCRGCSITLL